MPAFITRRFFGWLGVGTLLAALVSIAPLAPAVGAGPSGWNIVTSPNTDPSQSNLFMDTACANAWSCWAVGGVIPTLGGNSQPNALIDSWNGSTWSIDSDIALPGTDASLLWSVDCVGASDCWAVGGQEPTGNQGPQTLAEHWDGSTWTMVPTPAVDGYLFSVTCSASADCWAVGDSVDSQGNPLNAIIYHWDGSLWSRVAAPSSGETYDQLESVTCTNGSDCWAVGSAGPNQIQYNFLPGIAPTVVGARALIEHWNGSAWSVSTGGSSGAGEYLTAVTCTGGRELLGGGIHDGRKRQPLLVSGGALEWLELDANQLPRSHDAGEHLVLGDVRRQLPVLGHRSHKIPPVVKTRHPRLTSRAGTEPAGRSSRAPTSLPLAISAG